MRRRVRLLAHASWLMIFLIKSFKVRGIINKAKEEYLQYRIYMQARKICSRYAADTEAGQLPLELGSTYSSRSSGAIPGPHILLSRIRKFGEQTQS